MARSCQCQRLLVRVASDAAFRLLPDPVRLLWFDIVAMASAAPVPGRLRFLHSVPSSVARLVTRPETEVATELRDLVTLGLLDLDADGVTLWLPGARDGSARAEAARRNGLAGGARRKGETLEQRRERRQAEMLLTLPGGGTSQAATQGTEKPEPKPPRPTTTTESLTHITEEATGRVGAQADWVSLGAKLVEVAQLDTARFRFDYLPVKGWMDAGCTAEVILTAVQRAVARPSYQPGNIRTLAYFAQAVEREREAQATAPAPRPRDSAEELARLAAAEARVEATMRRYAAA